MLRRFCGILLIVALQNVVAYSVNMADNIMLGSYSQEALSGAATQLILNLIVVMGFIMIGMSYQMPVSFGIIQGKGNTKFTMKRNLISTWCIVMPLSFMTAFW